MSMRVMLCCLRNILMRNHITTITLMGKYSCSVTYKYEDIYPGTVSIGTFLMFFWIQ